MNPALKELYRTMLTTRCLNKEIIQTEGKIEVKLTYKYYLSTYTFYMGEATKEISGEVGNMKMSCTMIGGTIMPKDELDLFGVQ